MGFFPVLIFFLVLIVVFYLIKRSECTEERTRTVHEMFLKVAKELKLGVTKNYSDYPMTYPMITGEIDGCKIIVQRVSESSNTKGFPCSIFEVTSTREPGISGDIYVCTKSSFLSQNTPPSGRMEFNTGDPNIDNLMVLSWSYPYTQMALFNQEVRGEITKISSLSYAFEITNHCIKAKLEELPYMFQSDLISLIRLMVSVQKNLSQSTPLMQRCIKNIKTDPIPQVRINNLFTLTSYFSNKTNIKPVLLEALKDPSIQVQVEAARSLGNKGMEHLLRIIKTDYSSLEDKTLIEIISILKENHFKASINTLKKVFYSSTCTEVQILILETFTDFSDQSLNPFLLELLDDPNPDLCHHIIEALGTCGKLTAVEKLYILKKSTFNLFKRRLINDSIAKIQAKQGEVENGWLTVKTLANVDGGLSMASQKKKGALSVK